MTKVTLLNSLIQYKFTELSELKIGETQNVFGLVKYCSKPEKTKGKDYKMTVSITDKSIGYDSKIICNLFNEKPENLPKITERGDVIVIHKLKISKYLDKPQGIGIQKQGYSVAVFSRQNCFDLSRDSFDEIVSKMSTTKNCFNITEVDIERVQQLLEWGRQMPSSQTDELETNLEALQFTTLSDISPGTLCALTMQVVSVVPVDYLSYQSLILFWDGTLPSCTISTHYTTALASTVISVVTGTGDKGAGWYDSALMARLGGKVSSPYLGCLLVSQSATELQQSLVAPGDYIYASRVSVQSSSSGPGVMLILDRSSAIGVLAQGSDLYVELSTRLNALSASLPCVADCVSPDIHQLQTWSLQDYGKMLKQFESNSNLLSDQSAYQFKLVSRVVSVHPSNEKEFFQSMIFYCTCCQEIKSDDFLSQCETSGQSQIDNCKRNLVPVPMVTIIFEDFTGWLTGIAVGRVVLEMLNLVMIDASQPEWWIRLFNTRDKEAIARFVHHVNRLKKGWVEAKLVFKRAAEGKVLPFIEGMIILDY